MNAIRSSEMSVNIYKSSRNHNSEGRNNLHVLQENRDYIFRHVFHLTVRTIYRCIQTYKQFTISTDCCSDDTQTYTILKKYERGTKLYNTVPDVARSDEIKLDYASFLQ